MSLLSEIIEAAEKNPKFSKAVESLMREGLSLEEATQRAALKSKSLSPEQKSQVLQKAGFKKPETLEKLAGKGEGEKVTRAAQESGTQAALSGVESPDVYSGYKAETVPESKGDYVSLAGMAERPEVSPGMSAPQEPAQIPLLDRIKAAQSGVEKPEAGAALRGMEYSPTYAHEDIGLAGLGKQPDAELKGLGAESGVNAPTVKNLSKSFRERLQSTQPTSNSELANRYLKGAGAAAATGLAAASAGDSQIKKAEEPSISLAKLQTAYSGSPAEIQKQYQDDLNTVSLPELPGADTDMLRQKKGEAKARLNKLNAPSKEDKPDLLKRVLGETEPVPPAKPAPKAAVPPSATTASAQTGKAPTPPAPTQMEAIMNKFQTKVNGITGAAKTELQDKMGELGDLEKIYRQEAKEAKSDLERRELAETMGHALAQFGAGLAGLQSGVDMSSGLKFNKTDWNQRYNAALDELKSNLADLREKRQEARLTTTEKAREGIQQAQFQTGLEASEQMQKERQQEAEKLAAIQAGQSSKEKELDRKLRREIAGIQAGAKIAAAQQKLGDKQQLEVDEAAANLTDAYETMQTGTKDEKKLATKKYQEYKAALNSYLGPQVVGDMEKKLQAVPWYRTKAGYLEETGPAVAGQLGAAVQQKRATGAPAPAATAGQAPAASAMVDMVAPDGRLLRVPAEKVKELEAKGARRK